MLNAYELFPAKEERDYIKHIVDLFNGRVVSISSMEEYDHAKEQAQIERRKRKRIVLRKL